MNASEHINAARLATTEGDFQAALDHYVWFHEHALEEDLAFIGVRLSFALVEWIELGRKFLPAADALQTKLLSYTTDLLSGKLDEQVLRDTVAINECLTDWQANHSLFCKLRYVDAQFTNRYSSLFLPSIFKSEDYSLAREYLKEPASSIQRLAKDLKESVSYIQSASIPDKDDAVDAMVNGFLEDVKMILLVHQRTGDINFAEELRERAIAEVASEAYGASVSNRLSDT
jgi:hypothetical protein